MKQSYLPRLRPKSILLIAISLATGLTCTANRTDKETMHMRELVPSEIYGWKAQGELESYNRETIFDYIDGAGEIYLLYDFRKVTVFRFLQASEPTILVELFDMGSSEEAFGIFSHAREAEEQGIGQGSEYRGGLLCFWKDRFFVCISSERETQQTKRAVSDLAGKIAEKIKVSGPKPELLGYLPAEDLVSNSARYFHKHTSLNYHYFVASDNILKLSPQTEAVLARYQPGQTHLLCVRYQDDEQAQGALDSFLGAFMPEGKETGIAQIDTAKWVVTKLQGVFLMVVFEAPTKAYAQDLVKAVQDKLSGSVSGERRDI
jgi:hypothetical protein